MMMKIILENLLNVFFPPFCVGCGKEGRYICEKCHVFAGEAALICPACDGSSFSGERHASCFTLYGLNGLANAWEYEGIVKKTLGTIKYRGITHAVQELVKSSFQMMAADPARFGAFLQFLLARRSPGEGGLPIITYVPMFLPKAKKRGFNQAELLAKEMALATGAPVANLLCKTRDTISQTKLDKAQRTENVHNSFAVRGELSLPQRVVLVDDIWTTGATMKECCKVLKKAGVKEVWGFTLARTA